MRHRRSLTLSDFLFLFLFSFSQRIFHPFLSNSTKLVQHFTISSQEENLSVLSIWTVENRKWVFIIPMSLFLSLFWLILNLFSICYVKKGFYSLFKVAFGEFFSLTSFEIMSMFLKCLFSLLEKRIDHCLPTKTTINLTKFLRRSNPSNLLEE